MHNGSLDACNRAGSLDRVKLRNCLLFFCRVLPSAHVFFDRDMQSFEKEVTAAFQDFLDDMAFDDGASTQIPLRLITLHTLRQPLPA